MSTTTHEHASTVEADLDLVVGDLELDVVEGPQATDTHVNTRAGCSTCTCIGGHYCI